MRIALLMLVVSACGSGPPPPTAPPTEHEEEQGERVSIGGVVLPRLPPDVEPDDPELEDGWNKASRALSMATPSPPSGDASEVEAWADGELTEWVERRAQAIGEAQHALERARHAGAQHSVVASAILGLAYSRFALDLHGIPTPDVFASSPERAHEFQEALRHAAAPLWQRALDAFGSCSSMATSGPAHSLDPWREFCDNESRAASAMLPNTDHDSDD